MKSGFWIAIVFVFSLKGFSSCAQTQTITNVETEAIAFPGAEGFGKYATGGRGGKVYLVTNLNDDGEGSLRKGVTMKEPAIIVFTVSGTIHLQSPLVIRGNKTIAGQSAPGDGICIADYPVSLGGDNIIIRFLRFRMGDRYQNKGKVAGSGHDDAFSSSRRKHIIIDHCSMSWSTDEVCSVYGGDSTTLQWNIIAEPLNQSYHFEKNDTAFQKHGFGGIWGGRHLTAHHNVFAHCYNRNPRFNGIRLGTDEELVDFRNNVIYNWGINSIYGGEGGKYNVVNNYFKYGPSTSSKVQFRLLNPSRTDSIGYGQFYVKGNYMDGSEEVTQNNEKGVEMGNNGSKKDKKTALVNTPFPVLAIPEQSAKDAFMQILIQGGCSLPARDTLDQRILRNIFERSGRIIDVQGGFPPGTPYEVSKIAWPSLKSLPPPPDQDKDGMPDEWEKKNNLNPADPADASKKTLHKHYTNIEVYLNNLVKWGN
ncbi:MAG: pectate lyase [Chitinophagaceae bacterium]|nr:pectate lyase [Chitinophagaceae bacterium]